MATKKKGEEETTEQLEARLAQRKAEEAKAQADKTEADKAEEAKWRAKFEAERKLDADLKSSMANTAQGAQLPSKPAKPGIGHFMLGNLGIHLDPKPPKAASSPIPEPPSKSQVQLAMEKQLAMDKAYANIQSQDRIHQENMAVKPKATSNKGRFYITSPTLIRAPQLDKPFSVSFSLETGERVALAEFQIKNKASKRTVVAVLGVAITLLIAAAIYFFANSWVIALGALIMGFVITVVATLMQKETIEIKTVPFDYGMSVAQQNGGVEAAFDALTYLQIPMIQVSKDVMDKINSLEQQFTLVLESINAVEAIKEKFLKKKESWWDKHGAMAMMMGFTIVCIILILVGSYLIGQQQIASWTTSSSNFLNQWGALAGKLVGIGTGTPTTTIPPAT